MRISDWSSDVCSSDLLERDRAAELGDALRAFVDREIAADAMAGAVVVVEAGLPQKMPRQGIELLARGAFGEARAGQRDVALENAGETVAHLGRGQADGTDRKRTRLNSSH